MCRPRLPDGGTNKKVYEVINDCSQAVYLPPFPDSSSEIFGGYYSISNILSELSNPILTNIQLEVESLLEVENV